MTNNGQHLWRTRWVLTPISLVLVLVVVLWARRNTGRVIADVASENVGHDVSGGFAKERGPLPVETMRIGEIHPVLSTRSFAGLLMSRQSSPLGFERAGRVVMMTAEEGDTVAAGQVLAKLDMTDLDARAKRTVSELLAAEAVLAERIAGPRPQEILASKARLASLQAKRNLAKSNLEREAKLVQQGAGSRQAFDGATFELESMMQQILEAEAVLDQLQEGTRSEQILTQRASRDSIEALLQEIEAERDDSLIRAPFAGMISRRSVDPGTVVSPGSVVLELMSEQLEGKFGLPVDVALELHLDQPVRVSVRGEFTDGWVSRIEPRVDRDTRTRAVYVRLDHVSNGGNDNTTSSHWVDGQVASLLIPETAHQIQENHFWVPSSALGRGGRGVWTLMVASGNATEAIIEKRAVEILKMNGDFSQVKGMIQPDERIVTSGLHRITPGMKVQQTRPSANTGAASRRSGLKR